MSEADVWRRWSTRLNKLGAELRELSEEETGSTIRERRYKEYLKLAVHHIHIAEDAATSMSEEVEGGELQPRLNGPSPSCRIAMTVRFAADMLGWTARKAAANAAITTAQYMLIRNGTGIPQPETVEKLFAALSRQGIDMAQLTRIVDNVLPRRDQQTETVQGSPEHAETSGQAKSIHQRPAPAACRVPPAAEGPGTTADERRPVEIIYQPLSRGDGDERPPPQWK